MSKSLLINESLGVRVKSLSDVLSKFTYHKEHILNSKFAPIFCAAVMSIAFAGCGGEGNPGAIPASKDGGSTQDAISNPAGVKERPSTKKAANSLPPQPPK